jgi:hypothetical protein
MAKYKKAKPIERLGKVGVFGGGFFKMNERAYKNAEKNLAKMK